MTNSLTEFRNRIERAEKFNSELHQLKNATGMRMSPIIKIRFYWPRTLIFAAEDYWEDEVTIVKHGKDATDWTYEGVTAQSKIKSVTLHPRDEIGYRWNLTIIASMVTTVNAIVADGRSTFTTTMRAMNPIRSALLRCAATTKRTGKIYFLAPVTQFST